MPIAVPSLMTREQLDGMRDGLDVACRSIESLVGRIGEMVNKGEIERMSPLIELLDTQSLLVCHDYLLMSVEEVEKWYGGPSDLLPI